VSYERYMGNGCDHDEILARILEILEYLLTKVDDMSVQSDIDSVTAANTDAAATLNADVPVIDGLLSQGISTSALLASVAPLQAAVAAVSALAHPVTTTSTTTSTG
jgi:hypothetical protein